MKGLHTIAWILLIVGGLNWGLSALGWDVVGKLGSTLSMWVYLLVGLSAIVELFTHSKNCRLCGKGSM